MANLNDNPNSICQHSAKLVKMRESAEERLVASMPTMEDSAPLIRKDRERDT
jgi:hypothetical protein